MMFGETVKRALAKVLAVGAFAAVAAVGTSGIATAGGCNGPCHQPGWEGWAQGDGGTWTEAVRNLNKAKKVLCGISYTVLQTNPEHVYPDGSLALRQKIRCDD